MEMATTTGIIMGIVLYLVVISTVISYTAFNMGYGQIGGVTFSYTPPERNVILESIPIIGDTLADGAIAGTMAAGFVTTLLSLLVWTLPEAIFPLWANIIFIKIPAVILVAAIIEVLLP